MRALDTAALAAADGVQIVVVEPPGFVFSAAFGEVVDLLAFAFAELGIRCHVTANRIAPGPLPIVVGANLLGAGAAVRLPPATILYNLEHLVPGYPFHHADYLDLLSRFRVWDFHRHNVDLLRRRGHLYATHVPIGHMPQMCRIAPQPEDVDLLFYGMLNERRQRLLGDLAHAGLHIRVLDRIYGDARDAWIARARIVLNLHLGDGGLFESVRVAYLLGNCKAVVSEAATRGEVDADLTDGLIAVPPRELAAACRALLADAPARQALAARGFAAIAAPHRRMSAIVATALAEGATADAAA